MDVRPFAIERFYERWEFRAELMLSSSDCESLAVADLLVLEPARVQEVFDIAVGYARERAGGRVISVDKASVFATSRLWRRIARATRQAGRP